MGVAEPCGVGLGVEDGELLGVAVGITPPTAASANQYFTPATNVNPSRLAVGNVSVVPFTVAGPSQLKSQSGGFPLVL